MLTGARAWPTLLVLLTWVACADTDVAAQPAGSSPLSDAETERVCSAIDVLRTRAQPVFCGAARVDPPSPNNQRCDRIKAAIAALNKLKAGGSKLPDTVLGPGGRIVKGGATAGRPTAPSPEAGGTAGGTEGVGVGGEFVSVDPAGGFGSSPDDPAAGAVLAGSLASSGLRTTQRFSVSANMTDEQKKELFKTTLEVDDLYLTVMELLKDDIPVGSSPSEDYKRLCKQIEETRTRLARLSVQLALLSC